MKTDLVKSASLLEDSKSLSSFLLSFTKQADDPTTTMAENKYSKKLQSEVITALLRGSFGKIKSRSRSKGDTFIRLKYEELKQFTDDVPNKDENESFGEEFEEEYEEEYTYSDAEEKPHHRKDVKYHVWHCRCTGFLGQGVVLNENANLKVLDFPNGRWSLMCLRCVGSVLPRRMIPISLLSKEHRENLIQEARIELATSYLNKNDIIVPSNYNGEQLEELVLEHKEKIVSAEDDLKQMEEDRDRDYEEEEEEEDDVQQSWQRNLPAFLQNISDDEGDSDSFADSDAANEEEQSEAASDTNIPQDFTPVDTSLPMLLHRLESRFDFCCLTPEELLRIRSWSDIFSHGNSSDGDITKRRPPNIFWYLPYKCPKLKDRRRGMPSTWPDDLKEANQRCREGNSCQYCHTREEFTFHPMRYKTIPCDSTHSVSDVKSVRNMQATRTLRFMCPKYHAIWEREAFSSWRGYWCYPCYNPKQYLEGKTNWETLLSTQYKSPAMKQQYERCHERWTNKRSSRNLREQILWLYKHCIAPCVANLSWALASGCDVVKKSIVEIMHPPCTISFLRLAYPGSHLMLPMKLSVDKYIERVKNLLSSAMDPSKITSLDELGQEDKIALSKISFLQQPAEVKLFKSIDNTLYKTRISTAINYLKKSNKEQFYLTTSDRRPCVANTLILATRIAETLLGTHIDKPTLASMFWSEEADEDLNQIIENKTNQDTFVLEAIKYARTVVETEEELQMKHRTKKQVEILMTAGISQKRASLLNCARNWNPVNDVVKVSLFGSSVQGLAIGESADTDLALGKLKSNTTNFDEDGMTWQNRGTEKRVIEILCNRFLLRLGCFEDQSLWVNQSGSSNLEVIRGRVPIMKYEPTDLPKYEDCEDTKMLTFKLHKNDENSTLTGDQLQQAICSWGSTTLDEQSPLKDDVFQDGITFYIHLQSEEIALAAITDLSSNIEYSRILKDCDLTCKPFVTFSGLTNGSYQLPLLFHYPFDVSMRFTGPRGTQFLRGNLIRNPEWQGLFFIIKMWGKSTGVIASSGPNSMLSSYALSVMVIDFIQRWCKEKNLSYNSIDPMEVRFSATDDSRINGLQDVSPRTSEALVDFFKHGYLFNYDESCIVFPSKHLGEIHKCAMEYHSKSPWNYTTKKDWSWSREGDNWQEYLMMSDPMEWKTNLMRFMNPTKIRILRSAFLRAIETINTHQTFTWSKQVVSSEEDNTEAVFFKQFSDPESKDKQLHHVNVINIAVHIINLDILKVSNKRLVVSDNSSDETEYECLWLGNDEVSETEEKSTELIKPIEDTEPFWSVGDDKPKTTSEPPTPVSGTLTWGTNTASSTSTTKWGTAVQKGSKETGGKGSKETGGKGSKEPPTPVSETLTWGTNTASSTGTTKWGTAVQKGSKETGGKGTKETLDKNTNYLSGKGTSPTQSITSIDKGRDLSKRCILTSELQEGNPSDDKSLTINDLSGKRGINNLTKGNKGTSDSTSETDSWTASTGKGTSLAVNGDYSNAKGGLPVGALSNDSEKGMYSGKGSWGVAISALTTDGSGKGSKLGTQNISSDINGNCSDLARAEVDSNGRGVETFQQTTLTETDVSSTSSKGKCSSSSRNDLPPKRCKEYTTEFNEPVGLFSKNVSKAQLTTSGGKKGLHESGNKGSKSGGVSTEYQKSSTTDWNDILSVNNTRVNGKGAKGKNGVETSSQDTYSSQFGKGDSGGKKWPTLSTTDFSSKGGKSNSKATLESSTLSTSTSGMGKENHSKGTESLKGFGSKGSYSESSNLSTSGKDNSGKGTESSKKGFGVKGNSLEGNSLPSASGIGKENHGKGIDFSKKGFGGKGEYLESSNLSASGIKGVSLESSSLTENYGKGTDSSKKGFKGKGGLSSDASSSKGLKKTTYDSSGFDQQNSTSGKKGFAKGEADSDFPKSVAVDDILRGNEQYSDSRMLISILEYKIKKS